MRIVSDKGDKGRTDLLGGVRAPKYHLRVEMCGAIDELNSFIGMARAFSENMTIKGILLRIQSDLFIIGSELSYPGKDSAFLKKRISNKNVIWLRNLCNDFQKPLKLKPSFVIYGETKTSSILDVTRAVCRRAERLIVKAKDTGIVKNQKILQYINRLSDILFLFARTEEESVTVQESLKYEADFNSRLGDKEMQIERQNIRSG